MGRTVQNHVNLSVEERETLKKHISAKKNSLESKKRAQILLDLDESQGTPALAKIIAAKRGVSHNSIVVLRMRFAEGGLDRALYRKKRATPPVEPKITGDVEAHIIATCCSKPPEGKCRWTLGMIMNRVVADGVIQSISGEAIRLVLKKRSLSRI